MKVVNVMIVSTSYVHGKWAVLYVDSYIEGVAVINDV